jgi:hypothetical protein
MATDHKTARQDCRTVDKKLKSSGAKFENRTPTLKIDRLFFLLIDREIGLLPDTSTYLTSPNTCLKD